MSFPCVGLASGEGEGIFCITFCFLSCVTSGCIRVEAGPSASSLPDKAVMLSVGLKNSRMHTSGSVISCMLVPWGGKAMICLSAQRKRARCPLGPPPFNTDPSTAETAPGTGTSSFICGATWGETQLATAGGRTQPRRSCAWANAGLIKSEVMGKVSLWIIILKGSLVWWNQGQGVTCCTFEVPTPRICWQEHYLLPASSLCWRNIEEGQKLCKSLKTQLWGRLHSSLHLRCWERKQNLLVRSWVNYLSLRCTAKDLIFERGKPQNVVVVETDKQSNIQLPDFLLFEVLRKWASAMSSISELSQQKVVVIKSAGRSSYEPLRDNQELSSWPCLSLKSLTVLS